MHSFKIFGPGVQAGVIQENVLAGLDFPVQMVKQTHGDGILELSGYVENDGPYDAMVSRATGVKLCIKSADCIPLVLADEEAGVIAAVHAGWRSLVQDIIPKTLVRMVEMGASAERIKVGIGPSLGTECAEFSSPEEEIPSKYHWAINGKRVDLNGIAVRQLADAGVGEEQVEKMDICTACDGEWFSWRRDETDKRFGTVIELV